MLTLENVSRAQTNIELHVPSHEIRTATLFTGVGYPEFLVLGMQFQITDIFALGAQINAVKVKRGDSFLDPEAAVGPSFRASYYFDRTGNQNFLLANVLNLDVTYLLRDAPKDAATELELTVGHEGIEGHGLGFLWATGLALCVSPDDGRIYSPAIKLGVHWNY